MTITDDVPEASPAPPEHAPTVTATPALFAGLALVAAFFMPLISAFGGLFTFSPWSYLRLAFEDNSDLDAKGWVFLVVMLAIALLGAGVAFTEARGNRIRPLIAVAGALPLGLLVATAIDVGSLKDFRYADMAAYLSVAAALVLVATALGGLDTSPSLRRMVYAASALLVIAGVAVPSTGGSVEDTFNEMFEGFESSVDETLSEATEDLGDAFAGGASETITSLELGFAVMEALETDHDINALVDCPDDIDREEGASTTCTFETFDSDDEFNVEVDVTSVDGSDFELDVTPSTEPN